MTYRTNLALTLSVLFQALSATGTVASAQQNLDSVACVSSELESLASSSPVRRSRSPLSFAWPVVSLGHTLF